MINRGLSEREIDKLSQTLTRWPRSNALPRPIASQDTPREIQRSRGDESVGD